MTAIEFLVQGSAPTPYRVTFEKEGAKLSAYCTCPAGENGQNCQHRFSILAGSASGIVSANASEASIVASWLLGFNLEEALNALHTAERELEKSQKSVADLKRKLMRYIRHYNQAPKTVKWKYFDPTRRITPTSAVTVH